MPETSHAARPVIELRQVAVVDSHTPEMVLIDDLTWRIEAGDYWVVGGLPGSGKSDLLATAIGLQKPLRGFYELFGRDTAELSDEELAKERLRIGLVFGNEGRLFQDLSIAEHVALPLAYHRNLPPSETASQVAEVLELVGLSAVSHRLPSSLHRYLRPRAALARALALRPEVLLLDEPVRGLARREVRWWQDFLCGLNKGHPFFDGQTVTLVVTTNDLSVWANQAQKFGLISAQRWTFLGGRCELKAHREPVLRELLDFVET
ncbi:MAG: ATP-binding cassette domain-containing protein [Verrucomicrobiales bacterium]|nr:ATP-binding cassette domain-containing protein [Verrucomicrobiales bacterium]